ncbi:hypothetical protein [Aeromicrobium sp.]|uniref:hypothetical protein n=1 Tax=Aeromicrobium sp. TaxID=1871063 RepID=UPI003512F0D3
MAHLDADVAAFVDGQLSPDATEAASRHVQDCARCRDAVAQQRHLKMRMQATSDVRPPASLLASLSELPRTPAPQPPPLWTRVLHSAVWGASGVVVGASLAVVLMAYVAGAPGRGLGDAVVPPVDTYAADFRAAAVGGGDTARPVSNGQDVMTTARMADLTANGWPCHGTLGHDLERVEGRLQAEGAVSLTYTDGTGRLELHEQTGALDTDRLHGFAQRRRGDHEVGVRDPPGMRTVVWDAEGVVYTVVTDVDDARLVPALGDLPAAAPRPGLRERVGHGLDRLTGWLTV